MTQHALNPRRMTIAAGICFLVLIVAGPIGLLYVPEQILVAGDPTQTAQNVRANLALFRLGIVAQIVIIFTEIVLTSLLYLLLKPSNHVVAVMAAFSRLAMTVVMAVNLMPLLSMAEAASGASYLTTFAPDQLDTLVLFFMQTHMFGTIAWQLLFALHLTLLGYLVLQSTYLPRLLGLALLVGGSSYTFDSFGKIYGVMDVPAYALTTNVLLGLAAVGEVGLGLWLLIKGVNAQKWQQKRTIT